MFGGLFKSITKAFTQATLLDELILKPQAEAASAQKKANAAALAEAKKTADLADQANNAANRKAPDLAALLAGNMLTKGVGSTMLTGPQGVASNSLTLGRNTLLGG